MTGLGILYAKEAIDEQDWAEVLDRDKPARLRELYWARRGASVKLGRQPFLKMTARWDLDRSAIGRRSDEPGDAFVYLLQMAPRVEERFEWLEVTEVFTTVPASKIEGAMRAWNGIADKHPMDFDAFRRELRRGRPSRLEQRCAADRVIEQIERKLAKKSYEGLLERYGYGTLVVGMPLWFAVHSDDPFRAENAIDDFATRTSLGLEELKRRVLRRRDCPFRKVVVVWETTLEAMSEWARETDVGVRTAGVGCAPRGAGSQRAVDYWNARGYADGQEGARQRTVSGHCRGRRRDPSQQQRQQASRRTMACVWEKSCLRSSQCASFRESARGGRTESADSNKVLDSECEATGAAVLPGKPTQRPGLLRARPRRLTPQTQHRHWSSPDCSARSLSPGMVPDARTGLN